MNRAALAFAMVILMAASPLGGWQSKKNAKARDSSNLRWAPPNVDAPIPTLSASTPCPVSYVLQQAAARANEMIDDLQNFTAQEEIRYEKVDQISVPIDGNTGHFDYSAAFGLISRGLTIQESRTPIKGTYDFPGSSQDTGVAALALIFHPRLQDDYDMKCEGADQWNGEAAWVIHFQQRNDKPSRTVQFRTSTGAYAAQLKGRAWISANSFQVLHLETNLVRGIGMMYLLGDAVSVDYAPVQFHTQNVQLWLPQSAHAFWDFGSYRVVFQHTFTNFLLFSVQTNQVIEKPKNP